jgi:1-acyl-sn-glycerol-3-phosphate acyltransferase
MLERIFGKGNDGFTEDLISRFPNKVGSFGYDPWGFNIKVIKKFATLGRFLYEDYFKVETHGFENIPKEGRCLVIANHSGQLPFDAILLGYGMVINPVAPRAPKGMYERFIPTLPLFSSWFSQMGGALGDPENCERMLEKDEAIVVFPEGARGISKPWKKRYQLERFGNGFVHMAMRSNAPIIPVGIAGCEEIMINFGNLDGLKEFLNFPQVPLLLPIVFPSKVIINIGKPIYFEGTADREYLVEARAKQVKAEVKRLMNEAREMREIAMEREGRR